MPEQYSPLGQQPYAPEQYSPLGLRPYAPEQYSPLGQQRPPDITADRTSLIQQTAAGQPVDPKAIQAVDEQATTLFDEGMKGLRRFGYSTIATGQAFAGTLLAPMFPKFGNDLIQEGLRTIQGMPADINPAVQNWADVHDLRSGALKFVSSVGEGLPSSALTVGSILAGRGLGRGAAALGGARGAALETAANRAGWIGGGATIVPGEGGEAALDLAKDPVAMENTTPWQRAGLVAGRGVVNAALEEAVPQALVVPHLLGKAARIAPGLRPGLRNIGLLAGEGALGEYGTEFAQDLTGQYVQNVAHPGTGYNFQQAHEAGLSGAATGIFLGGTGGAAQAVHSNIGAGVDLAKEGVAKVRNKLPSFEDVLRHTLNTLDDPEGAGRALAGATLEGIAKAGEVAGAFKDYAVKGVAPVEDFLSKTYDNTVKFIGKNVKDPELRDRLFQRAAELKTLTMPEWNILKRDIAEAGGAQFMENVGAAAAVGAQRAWEGTKNVFKWGSDAVKGFASGLAKDTEGKASISAPDAGDRATAMAQFYAAAPGLKDVVEKMAPSLNAKRDMANMLHYAINNSQFLEGAAHDPARAAALAQWTARTGTDLNKIVDAIRTHRNDVTFEQVAADKASNMMHQLGINPEHHDDLIEMVRSADGADYDALPASQQRLLTGMAGDGDKARALYAALESSLDKGLLAMERQVGEAGRVKSQIPALSEAMQTGTVTGAATSSDEGGTTGREGGYYDELGNRYGEAASELSPFNKEAVQQSLTTKGYENAPGTRIPITLTPQGEHANLDLKTLANAIGERHQDKQTKEETWHPFKQGRAPVTRQGVQLHINPMSLTSMMQSEKFRDQFHEHMIGLDDRPGASSDEVTSQRFMNALAALQDKGIHLNPEDVGLPKEGGPVHVKVGIDLKKLQDNLIIRQYKGGKHKLTWADVSGKTRKLMNPAKHLERLQKFNGNFTGAYQTLADEGEPGQGKKGNPLSEKIAGVIWRRARNQLRETAGLDQFAPVRNPTPAELDAAAKAYHDAIPGMQQAREQQRAIREQMTDLRNAYRDETVSAQNLEALADWYGHEKGSNLAKAGVATAAIHDKVIDREAVDTSKLAEQIREMVATADLGREAFSKSVTGSDITRSTESDILGDWLEFRNTAAQKAERYREGTQAIAMRKGEQSTAPSTREQVPPQPGHSLAITWNINGKRLARSAAKYEITAVTQLQNGGHKFSFKNIETGKEYKNYIVDAEGVSQTGSKFHFLGEPKVTKATPEDYAKPATTTPAPTTPKPAAAPAPTGVTKTMGMWYRDGNLIGGVRHEMLPAFRGKSTLDLIKSGDRTATTRPLDQVRGVKEGDLIRFAASGQEPVTVRVTKAPYPVKDITPAQWSKLEGWKPELYDNYKNAYQFQYERVQPKVDESRGRGMMTLPERYAEIRKSAPQDKVTFLNKQLKKPLTHTDLNNLVQEWANKYLPGVPVTLHIYAKQSGDPRGFVDRQIGANTIYIASEHADRVAALATTAHEFGHLLQYNHFNEASAEVKKSIFAAYNADIKALTSGKLTTEQAIQRFGNAANAIIQRSELGNDSLLRDRMQGAILGGTVHTDEELEYATSFREWFANQFSKMVTSSLDRPVTMAERSFWDALSKKVKDFYDAVVKKLTPSTAYEAWVKELAKSQGDVTSAAIDGATPPPPKPPSPPPPPGPGEIPPGGNFPSDEAKQRFSDLVRSMMGPKVQVLFDRKLAKGVKGEFYTKREALDKLYKRRNALVEERKNAKARSAQNTIDDLTDQIQALDAEEKELIADTAVQGFIYLATGMEKKNGLAEHETFHAGFHMFFDENERRTLGQAFTQGLAGARLREIFKDDPVVLARIDPLTGSAEEAAAYAFEIWAQDPSQFQLGPKTETIFQKMLNFVRKVIGVLTLNERAQMIMESLKSGRRYEQNISPVQKILDKDTAWQERAQKMAQDVGGLLKQGYDILLSPARERLIDTENPALTKIAKLAYQQTGEEGNEGGMTQRGRKQFKLQQNELNRIFDKLTEPQLQALHQHMILGTTLSDPVVAERAKQLHQWFRDMYAYQTKKGVLLGNMGVKEDYYPLTWSPEKVLKNKQAFIDMLEQPKYAEKMLSLKKTPNELYNSITSYIDRGEDLVNVMGQNNEPLSESSKARTLDFIAKEDRIPFMDDDPIHTSVRYMKQAIRQAEYVDSFGMNGDKLKAMKEEAKNVYGATPDQLALVNDYIDGTLGNKEVGMSRELKDLYGALNVYENYRLLPFSLFSSLIDPMGIAIRSNSVRDAWETFSYSIKGLFNEWKKDYPRDFWAKYAEDMGIIEHSGTTISAHNQFDGITLRGTTKSLNDKLFKYNLLNGWVRNNTIMATKAGQRFIYRAAEGDFGPEHSARYLDELGLTKDDVIYDKTQERLLLYADELEAAGMSKADAQALETKLGNAIEKFVRQSLLNPNSAELPNWMSNPYMMPIAHLKQFVFAFEATILKRVTHEMQHGNFKPVALAASYVPGMIAADFMKDMIAGFGDEPPYKKGWGFFDYFNDGVQRSGLLGSGQFFTSMQEDIARGGGGYETAFGPAAQQLQQGVKAFSSGDGTAIKNWMIKSGPLMPVYKQHLISGPGAGGGGKGSGGSSSSAWGLADDVVMAAAKAT